MSLYYYCEILSVWQKKANIDFGLLSYTFLKKDPNGTSDSFFSMLLIYSPLSIKKNQRFLQPCDKTEPWNFVMKSSHLPYLISITVDAQLHKLLSEFLKSYWWKQIWVVYSSSFAQFGHIFVSFFSLSIDCKPENYWPNLCLILICFVSEGIWLCIQ